MSQESFLTTRSAAKLLKNSMCRVVVSPFLKAKTLLTLMSTFVQNEAKTMEEERLSLRTSAVEKGKKFKGRRNSDHIPKTVANKLHDENNRQSWMKMKIAEYAHTIQQIARETPELKKINKQDRIINDVLEEEK